MTGGRNLPRFALRSGRSLGISLMLVLACASGTFAQSPSVEPPVRYDQDFLPPSFHQERRARVLDALPPEAIAIFFSAAEGTDPYVQDPDLYYLTGSTEPNTVLLLAPSGVDVDGEVETEVLFVPPRTRYSEVWLGRRFGVEGAEKELGIERAVSNERFGEILERAASDQARQFFHLSRPEGIISGSDLAEQVAAFENHARPLSTVIDPSYRREVFFALGADDEDRFERVQRMISDRISEGQVDGFAGEILEAFLSSQEYEEWEVWRSDRVEGRFADGTRLRSVLTDLRMNKTSEELDLLKKAIDITSHAHIEVARVARPGMREYELQAVLEYIFMREGAERPGFSSIVGSGENSVILHYSSNRRQMEDGDLVVVDIGASYRGYTADITRTLPVNGSFSEEQRAVYELVLAAQEAGIEAARAGNAFGAAGQAATMVIAEGLMELWLITELHQVRRFFMHGTSHYLGLEVHDVGDYGELAPGQVITVEPGIYIPAAQDIDPRWWNIGVRIEDDVLITASDPVVLSARAPKTVAEVEVVMRQSSAIVP